MLTRDVRLEGFTTRDWVRLAEVFKAPIATVSEDPEPAETVVPPATRRGGVIAHDGGPVAQAPLDRAWSAGSASAALAGALADLAERHSARWAVEIQTGALDELMERVGSRMRREHDTLTQIILFTNVFRELESEGKISVYPLKPKSWPVPREKVVLRALDALCPNEKSMLLGVFDQGEVFTAILARRNGSGFDLILGPDKLRTEMGLISGDWRRDYRHLARAAESEAGELALGCFGELETLKQLVDSPAPGAWAAAVASRDVILSPAVPAVAIPLGIDVGRAAFVAVRGLAERMGAGAWLGPDSPIAPALGRLREITGVERDVTELIGFDPIAILKKLFSRERE